MRPKVTHTLIGLLFLSLLSSACMETPTYARLDQPGDLFQKKDVTIVVTDSGLGGLSIVADAEQRMLAFKNFRSVRLVFFNALFSEQGGYNSLRSRSEKIRVFDSALLSIEEKYHPDLILIGCNTLSVLHPDTAFSRESGVPVTGIVDAGVDLIAQGLRQHPESRVLIFGTQTTVAEGTYRRELLHKGFLTERIIQQACPDLVPYIERGYDSDETEMLISAYAAEAIKTLPDPSATVLVSLNCTHYGYSLDLWRSAFLDQGIQPAAFLNPNRRMLDFLFIPETQDRYQDTRVSVEVVSMVEIGKARQKSIGSRLRNTSPQTTAALSGYQWDPALFEWESYVKRDWSGASHPPRQ
ncbi:MAG: aspartate/glutamate racemase family protein [Candidatus Aminicenantaceae bacterium]